MKKLVLLTLIAMSSIFGHTQCTNGSAFGTATAPSSGSVTISTCSFQSEYSTLNGVAAATIYQCAILTGGYITIHQGTPAGPVIASGNSPLQWNSTVAGTYYAHWNTNSSCGLASSCVTTTMTYISPATPCIDPANAGSTVSSVTNACPTVPFNLSLSGATIGSGLTYQWQSSLDGISYTNISGATNSSYSATQVDTTFYQCIVTCGAGTPVTSTSVQVNMNPFYNCYCTSNATSTFDEEILNVTVGTLNNSSTCAQTGGPGSILNQYSNYTTLPAPILAATAGYNFSIDIGTCNGNYNSMTKIFIDYNQNGSFADAGETVYVTPTSTNGPHIVSGSFIVPPTATVGITRMRVVNTETSSASAVNPCGTYGYGETEDYLVNIAPIPTCPQPTAFSLSSADLTSAIFQWTAGGTETQWVIEYGPIGFAPGTGTAIPVSTNPDTLTGLTPDSFYSAYIYGICNPGVDSSYYAGAVNWNTYNQDQFMEVDTECPTAGFVDISSTGTLYTLNDDDETALTFPFPILYQGVLYTNGTLGNNGALIFGTTTAQVAPGNLTITGTTATGLYPFWEDLETAGGGVWVDTVGTAPNRQYIIQWQKEVFGGVGNPVNVELIIDEATFEIYYVYDDVFVDNPTYNNGLSTTIGAAGPNQDFQISYNNTTYLNNNSCAHLYYTDCPKPTNLTISYITQDEAAFTWTPGLANETNWTIVYGPAGCTDCDTITSSTPSITLPNLTHLTNYDIIIFSDCNLTMQSAGLNGTFQTLPWCSNPTGITNTTDIDSIFTSWTWTAADPINFPIEGFNITYGNFGFDINSGGTEINSGNVLSDTIADATLLAGGVYQIYLQAVCTDVIGGGTDTSLYIGPFSVTMPLTNDSVCGAEMLMADGTVYTFNNTGATLQPNENSIAPPTTGAQTTTGWINSTLNNTTWFTFVAPASGSVRVNNTAINYAGQSAIYESSSCSNFTNFELLAANDNSLTGTYNAPNYTVCGLTPGVSYYMLHDGNSATVGNYSISITPINLEAGSFANLINVCAGDTSNLFNGITGYQNGGLWTAQNAAAGTGIDGNLFNSAGLAFQVFNFEYRVTDGCAYDSIVSQVEIYGPSSAGADGSITVCRNQPVDLLAGLSGNVDFGGSWYNPSNQLMPGSEIYASNIPGQFNYDYITGNGVCPDDTANVLLTVNPTCDWLAVEELAFNSMTLYPNPTNGILYISNVGSTEVFNYEITDVEGRIIATKSAAINGINTTEVNLNDKVTGTYMIRVFNDTAEKVFRVVLQ